MKKAILVFLFAVFCCSGCALTVNEIPLNYQPPAYEGTGEALKVNLSVGEVQDNRGHDDPCLLFHKINGNGRTASGGFEAEKPVSDIVKGALKEHFAGYPVVQGAVKRYELVGSIEETEYSVTSGWVSSGFVSEITVKLYLKDLSSGDVVWNDVFTGKGKQDGWMGGTKEVGESFNKALDDLINKLSSSPPLKNKIIS